MIIKTVQGHQASSLLELIFTIINTGQCQFPTLIGDGFCQDFMNNRHCHFDKGDCCGPCVNKDYCSDCECKTGTRNGISNALVGDGFCQDTFNIEDCNYDGGDCCGSCVNTKYCSECNCFEKNPIENNVNNAFLGDGICQDDTNNVGCHYDNFDCCGNNFSKSYCDECQCHGMYFLCEKINSEISLHSSLF